MVPGEGVGERPQLVPPDTELGAGGEAEPADVRTHQRQPEHRELSSKEIFMWYCLIRQCFTWSTPIIDWARFDQMEKLSPSQWAAHRPDPGNVELIQDI